MKKNFKPHMMWPKKGEGKMAKTYAEHLKYKKMGWGHTKPKKQFGGQVMKNGGQVQGCGCPYGMEMGPNTVL